MQGLRKTGDLPLGGCDRVVKVLDSKSSVISRVGSNPIGRGYLFAKSMHNILQNWFVLFFF